MTIKVGEKEYCLDGYANTNELQKALAECYENGRADAIDEFVDTICSMNLSLISGVVDTPDLVRRVGEQLKEQTNESI